MGFTDISKATSHSKFKFRQLSQLVFGGNFKLKIILITSDSSLYFVRLLICIEDE